MAMHESSESGAVTRRELLKGGAALPLLGTAAACAVTAGTRDASGPPFPPPLVVSTWSFGQRANAEAMKVLRVEGGSVLDAVERGVGVVEADPEVSSVGLGGTPDAGGTVTLDASIMNGDDLSCGGVAALRGILHPVSVARKVMEETPHVLLVGEGALAFAREQGFEEAELLTPKARARWEAWKKRRAAGGRGAPGSVPPPVAAGHDTIGMIALDGQGHLAAAVTTSGIGFKRPGRVGDSPLVGAGIYADAEAGAAVSTGLGEEAIRTCGSFLAVELMRQGASPMEAVRAVLYRVRAIRKRRKGGPAFQLAFLAVSRDGRVGGAALRQGFTYALSDGAGRHELVEGAVA